MDSTIPGIGSAGDELPDIAERLATLLDPRGRRGRRHSLVSVLLTPACAVLAGARPYLAIGQWARHAPHDCLARPGIPSRGPLGIRRAPATSTIRAVLHALVTTFRAVFQNAGRKIASRKETQISSIAESTWSNYVRELRAKYDAETLIPDTPKVREQYPHLIGKPLKGTKYIEVPVQSQPVPDWALKEAAKHNVVIRDVKGHVYRLPKSEG